MTFSSEIEFCLRSRNFGLPTLSVPETVRTARDLPVRPRQVAGMIR